MGPGRSKNITEELLDIVNLQNQDGEIKLDPQEVNAGGFFSTEQIQEMINSATYQFTPWFLDEWKFLV